ncbi:ribosome recycling factor [Candidatus Kaiserbacteria bacterium RIFCSPHIGHO2_02_FULL_49_11]|uniref:Ribosome recycling factor n=1 Tax=Candidatus Kaiserbacteria bacterium RIFCSPHIGHO2_02_FULL_49_11 TaxID=1798489 RepID=A0A1F6D111_9BACT|nr:MAG: ribosome recycling factor [Candidatus Kaiserbacteria bacterium RIFCSPHIGHO2_02_FULL_49_11]
MAYDFSPLKKKVADTEEWLKKEYQGIRTGRATPTLLDGVLVESYGSRMPLIQVGSVSVEDARTIRIAPWDQSQIKAIEKGVTDANLGVGVSADERGVRVTFPELTSERRGALMKIAKDKLEDARVSLRGERDRVWSDIQKKEKESEISEDEKFRYKDEMQKLVDEGNKKLDILAEKKRAEIES